MKTLIEEIAGIVRNEDEFLVLTHVQPDGDGFGAMLAMGHLLEALGKKYTLAVANTGDIPPQYKFLPGADRVKAPESPSGKVLIALDAANLSRLGTLATELDRYSITINVDHHPDNSAFAKINWVDPAASSASEMIYDLWLQVGMAVSKAAALCIYVGMLTDTGRWQYSNTTGRCLEKAAKLLDAGVKPIEVFRRIFESYSVEWFKLLSVGLQKAVFDQEAGLAHAVISQSDLKATGANMAETENLVDWLRAVAGINVAMVLKETRQGEIKVSLRSQDPIDVGLLARGFGGGGHRNASGFISKDEPASIVRNVKKWLTDSS